MYDTVTCKLKIIKPRISHHKDYYELTLQPKWQKEFLNMRTQNADDVEKEISNWVSFEDSMFPSVLRLIEFDDKIIGFIANTPAGYDDELKSEFKMLINYAISEEYEGKGFMSKVLSMFINEMYEIEFNIMSAFVKPGNISSEKVLINNSFDLVRDNIMGKSFVKALKINLDDYKNTFGSQ